VTGLIYHITSSLSWKAAQKDGLYSADLLPSEGLASQGFIHCSKVDQILRVANTFYANQPGLVILAIDPSKLKPQVRWEPGTDKADELFPHIFGPLNLEAVVQVFDFEPNPDGIFHLPISLSS
jgi:uncharacterized protein (DUF952 family)